MNYTIQHKTAYTYFHPVSCCHNILKLLPRNTHQQYCKSSSVKIFPQPDVINEYEDFFGNKTIYFSIEKEHRQLTVNITSAIEKQLNEADEINLPVNSSMEAIKADLQTINQQSVAVKQYVFEIFEYRNKNVLFWALFFKLVSKTNNMMENQSILPFEGKEIRKV